MVAVYKKKAGLSGFFPQKTTGVSHKVLSDLDKYIKPAKVKLKVKQMG